jgi:tetraacyldisaccharide-1-P 4'-kinase
VLSLEEALEQGAWTGPLARVLAHGYRHTLGGSVQRALSIPSGVRVVAVGGATLGGSGKTPLSIACARELAASGARTTLVGHAHRANPGHARIVSTADPIEQVGDEALIAARVLGALGARVVVAPTRAAAIAFAAREADVLVLDGVPQVAPVRASLALLSLDGFEPWGHAAALPPRGDLRAPRQTLIEACDAIVPIVDGPWPEDRTGIERWGACGDRISQNLGCEKAAEPIQTAFESRLGLEPPSRDIWPAHLVCRGAWDASGNLWAWEALRCVRIGLLTALARPDRVLRTLARRGVLPRVVLRGRDHGPIEKRHERERRDERIDLWLATPKCALHARNAGMRTPLATLDHSVVLHPRLCARLGALAVP